MLYLSKTVAKITFLLLLTLMLVCPAGYRHAAEASASQTGIISAWKLNVRSAPSRDADVLVVLSQNDRVDVIEKKGGIGDWLKISVNGQTGYIRNRPRYVTLIDTIRPKKLKQKPVKEQTAQPAASGETPPPRQEKKRIEQKIKAEEEKIATFSRKEEIIIEGLNEIDATLNRARLKVDSISERIRELEGAIADIREKRKAVAASFRENQEYCATRLSALFRMKMLGKIGIAAEPDSLFDFIVNQTAMERIISADLQLMNNQIESLKQFADLEKQLKKKKSEKMTLEKELKQEILTKERESEKKSAILAHIRNEKKLARAAVASLREAEKQLDRQIEYMKKKDTRHLSGASIIPYKGQLEMPVSGKIISRFGTNRTGDYKSFTFQSGIDISVERGEPVRAVFHGKVLFAQWFKGYGNLMIINHGDSYYTLYAHVEEFFKKKGDPVEKGEVIATAGDTGSIKGLCLHFEIRHHGKPVNPMDWLRKGA